MTRLINQSFQPRGLIGGAATKLPRTTREMVEVLDQWERVQNTLPLGHGWIEGKFYAREGFSMRKVLVTPAGRKM